MGKILRFDLNSKETIYIQSKDKKLDKLVKQVGSCHVQLQEDYYISLVKSIIGQQLSLKAADTIWNRFCELCKDITPENIILLSDDRCREIGISKYKICYIKDLSFKIINKSIDLQNINNYEDEEVINILTQVKGIGRWTAQMFLIFSLGRLNVFSAKDLGLRKAVGMLYCLDTIPGEKEVLNFSQKFAPYKTVLSLYLWEALNKNLFEK
ncbi:DNA-3-methyladenine glycosylase II [Alkalithermobacter thermoalcaliphilus JW-YL-7 = DSM 7308]|uniref:DNA-3-methyladenine glycosylase II n=1 Tax=Alkalithermobacter thermoalcaliphilus JW-YL-7 = DSM 7308 TaxID=1121328 RepID=A0A150FQL8_CLOPD|nr:HhH-GPD family protein [[Clostridium] paradoxum JW-YL-7 = DSM 7308]SHK78062.1 DNA-3-methyladenine glycosylase II [[Clostridium] paradoxum JW-YL-7 = DSM 7308]